MKRLPIGTQSWLDEFWQKKPFLLRNALPQLAALANLERLTALACRSDVESRLVFGSRKTWRVEHGPFRRRDFERLPPRDWTLLVNGVESFMPAARAVQQLFDFVPYSRQDDVMISYAAPGGSVGPHYDSYDVFLVQGAGSRRWQVGDQRDLALVEGAPLKVLQRFRPRHAWTLHAGDLLYLPPRYAHHGVAADHCVTWSIGCRAPTRQEMASRFLDFLHDGLKLDGDYRDPGLRRQRSRAAISGEMLRQARDTVAAIRWTGADVARSLGEYLSEPRSNLVFGRTRAMSVAPFMRAIEERGLRLSLKSRMLTHGRMLFINGETEILDTAKRGALHRLADHRALPPHTPLGKHARALLYRWYRAGYIEVGAKDQGPKYA